MFNLEGIYSLVNSRPRVTTIAFATAVGLLFSSLAWVQSIDQVVYDSMLIAGGIRKPSDEVVVVAIDEPSFEELNMQWPWPRRKHAELLESLYQAGAKTVALDILFTTPSNDVDDDLLANAIAKYPNTVLAAELDITTDPYLGYSRRKLYTPQPIINRGKKDVALGLVNIPVEDDGFIRRLTVFPNTELPLSFMASQIHKRATARESTVQKAAGSYWIPFYGPPKTVRTISYYQALDPERFLTEGMLEDKLVFVGFVTDSDPSLEVFSADHYPVPFSRSSSGYMAGVEIHAHAASAFLEGRFVRVFGFFWTILIAVAFSSILGAVFLSQAPRLGALVYLSSLIIISFTTYYLFSAANIYLSPITILLPLTCTFIASPFFHYSESQKKGAFLGDAFRTYLPAAVVEQLIVEPERLKLGGEELSGTVIFVDIVGFTNLSETLSASGVVEMVNRYLGHFADIVLENQGMVDKFIGDCLMAVWGVPIRREDHATKACQAVLSMREALVKLNEQYQDDYRLQVRVGVNSGDVIAGNIGGGRRFSYTVLGSEVNLAARLEGVNKFYSTNLLISDGTARLVKGNFHLRELDTISVIGQERAVAVYELRDSISKELSQEESDFLGWYAEGLQKYRSGEFQEAIGNFARVLQYAPQDGPTHILLNRSRELLVSSPRDWDGVYHMRQK